MCPDSGLLIDTTKIMGQENVPVMTYLEAILSADGFLFFPVLMKASL